MKTTWKSLLAGTAALAIVACTPAETEEAAEAEAAPAEAAPAETVDAGEEMMAEDGTTTEGADEETPRREEHGNPAGPVTTQAE